MRVVRSQDWPRVRVLHARLFADEPIEGPDLGNVYWLAYDDDDDVVGFCSARASLIYADCAFMSRSGVCQRARGNGLQRRMLTVRLRWAKREGFRYAVTFAHKTNTPSIINLLRSGFQIIPTPKVYVVGPDYLHFKRRLR